MIEWNYRAITVRMWSEFVMLSLYAITSHLTKQWIANVIRYKVAISVTFTYIITNTANEFSSHQFTCNLPRKKTAETSFFSAVSLDRQLPVVLHWDNSNVKFIPITMLFPMHLSSINHYNCLNITSSPQFHHTINILRSYQLKFACHRYWQIGQKKNCCVRKKLFHLTLIVQLFDSLWGLDWWGYSTVLLRFEIETWDCR